MVVIAGQLVMVGTEGIAMVVRHKGTMWRKWVMVRGAGEGVVVALVKGR